jgi:integrase
MTDRPLEFEEYKQIMNLITEGFTYFEDNKEKTFRPNSKLYLALTLQASLGLRIGDVLSLTPNNFRMGKLIITEDKTDKMQNREVNPQIIELVKDYAIEEGIKANDKLFNRLGVRAVQKQLKIITNYLGLENISTHSFRKMYAVNVYEQNNNNIELVKELLNHTSIATTQRYIRVKQKEINAASKKVNFIIEGK